MPVTREQVVAYRLAAHGLHRDGSSVADLAVLDLGVQEAMGRPAALAFIARLPRVGAARAGDVVAGTASAARRRAPDGRRRRPHTTGRSAR